MLMFYARNQDSEVEGDSNGDLQIASPSNSEAQQALTTFWPKVTEEIKKITAVSISYYNDTMILEPLTFIYTLNLQFSFLHRWT